MNRVFAQLPTRDDKVRVIDFLHDFQELEDQHVADNRLINETFEHSIRTILANAADDVDQMSTSYLHTTYECLAAVVAELNAIFTDFKQKMIRESTHEGRLRLEAEIKAIGEVVVDNFEADQRDKVSHLVTLSAEEEAHFHRVYDIWRRTQNFFYEKQDEEMAQFAAETFAGTNINAVRFAPFTLVFEVKSETDPAGFCDVLLWLK